MNAPLVQTDASLLAGLASGNRRATETVYRQHRPTVVRWLAGRGCGADDAAEVYQEAMVVLFEKALEPDFRLQCRIGTYLFAVARHLWLKKLGAQSRAPVPLVEESVEDGNGDGSIAYEDDLAAHAEREAHYAALDQALDSLGEPCRGLLHAYYYAGRSMAQIAADAGYTNADTAKTQKYKCLARLKKRFFSATTR